MSFHFLNWLAPKGQAKALPAAPSEAVARAPWESRVAFHETTTRRSSFTEDLDLYEAAGVAGIGLCTLKLADWSPRRIALAIRARGLSVSSVGIAGGFTRFNQFTLEDAVREGTELIELAARVGAPVVRVVSGPVGTHIRAQARRALLGGLEELLPVAKRCGVQLALQPMALQFHKWSFLHTLNDAMEIVHEFSVKELGLAFGTYHLGGEVNLLKRLEKIAPHIATVQLADWVPTRSDTDRRLPGEGRLPLPEIVSVLEASGYRGWYELEVWSRDLWNLDAATLMTCCQQSVGSLNPVATPVAHR